MDRLDEKTASRMGYETLIAAVTVDTSLPIEIGLLPPRDHDARWYVVSHFGTDPEIPEIGSSSMDPYDTEAEARAAYAEALAEDYGIPPEYRGLSEDELQEANRASMGGPA
jgi:hypothetical protein